MTWASKLVKPYRIEDGGKFRLKAFDPGDTVPVRSKEHAQRLLRKGIESMAALQDKLYAQDRWAVLLIFQAMDAAGKDGVIKHVMSGVNPQGCEVHSFKTPSVEELNHDPLWRTMQRLPERGKIGIFNRSYYEEVLIVRVHPEQLAEERLPARRAGPRLWQERFEDINHFEQHLARNGTLILKFFLNLSKAEQRRRLLERLDARDKRWKFSAADLRERDYWNDYARAYEAMLLATSTPWAPWYVVPADHKFIARAVVASILVSRIGALDLRYPRLGRAAAAELAAAHRRLAGRGRRASR